MGDILKSQIKLMQSQNLDDTDEGGGAMTVNEVIDGNINNLFPDISRLDRTYGRVSLRKAFLSVRTEDRSVYYGSHVAVTEQTKDPLVSVLFFTTNNWFDRRAEAINRIESYLAIGTQYMAALYGDHYKGSRLVALHSNVDVKPPNVGDVLIINKSEYIRITDIVSETREFAANSGQTYKKQIITMEISNPLENDYTGTEVSQSFSYTTTANKINVSVVADASKYYGVSKLKAPIASGDMQLQVNSIMQSIVPSAQSANPITDFGVGTTVSSMLNFDTAVISRSITWGFAPNAQLYIGEAVKAGSFSYSVYTDDSKGNIVNSSNTIIGSIDYLTGTISLGATSPTSNITSTLNYTRAAVQEQVSHTGSIDISIANRYFSYVYNFYPNPSPRTVKIDYMSGGKWYSLYDVGNGQIKGESSDLGTGILNYTTGTLSLTLGYLPDIDSNILFFWGKDYSILPLTPSAIPLTYEYTVQAENKNIARNSLQITWTQDSEEKTIIDDGLGDLTQSGTTVGTVSYGSGKLSFSPTCTPIPQTQFNINYSNGVKENYTTSSLSGILPLTDIVPQSISFDIVGTCESPVSTTKYIPTTPNTKSESVDQSPYVKFIFTRTLSVVDDGNGILKSTLNNLNVGTIDYDTGAYTITLANEYIRYAGFEKTVVGIGYTYSYLQFTNSLVWNNAEFTINYLASDGHNAVSEQTTLNKIYDIDKGNSLPLLAGSCSFTYNTVLLQDNKAGKVVKPEANGSFTEYGDINYSEKTVKITKTDSYSNTANLALSLNSGAVGAPEQELDTLFFRTPAIPVVPASLIFRITDIQGNVLTASSNLAGDIVGTNIKGRINYDNGVVLIDFGFMDNDGWQPINVITSSAIISCVVSTYMPLNASLLGLNPIRLPIDGKIPVFKDGDILLIHHTLQYTCPNNLTANQSFNVGRTGLSMIELYDADGVYIPETDNYTVDLGTGTVMMSDPLNLSAYRQPLVALHRIEDMVLASDVQVTGHIAITSPVKHDYDADTTLVSSVLPLGDLQARVYNEFTQQSWTGEWSDTRIGNGILAQYNSIDYPIEVVNKNAPQERWAFILETTNTVKIVGEHLGVVATGVSILADIAYPANGNPYFIIRKEGWGSGWAAGNVFRVNTAAANYPLWFCRTTLQGTATENEDHYTVVIRGDSA